MLLFKCLIILFFCLGGMFSLSRVLELCIRVWERKADRSQIARLKTSNDLFLAVTWLISGMVCAFVFTAMILI
jgi:hypothetical protein